MSTRTNIRPQPVIIDGGMSATSITSAVTILQSVTRISYGLSWVGTVPVGTAAVQVSNDYSVYANGSVHNTGTWTTLILDLNGVPVSSIPISGSPGSAMIDIDGTAVYAIRLVYTKTSGTGTLQAIINGKVS